MDNVFILTRLGIFMSFISILWSYILKIVLSHHDFLTHIVCCVINDGVYLLMQTTVIDTKYLNQNRIVQFIWHNWLKMHVLDLYNSLFWQKSMIYDFHITLTTSLLNFDHFWWFFKVEQKKEKWKKLWLSPGLNLGPLRGRQL